MRELKRFLTKIDTWGSPIIMRAFDKEDAEGLAQLLFKVPSDVNVTATEEEPEPESELVE